LHTKIFTDGRWRSLPLSSRAVFLHLVALSGAQGNPGSVEGTESELAGIVGCPLRDFRNAVDNLSLVRRDPGMAPPEGRQRFSNGGPMVSRRYSNGVVTGLIIRNWQEYQANGPHEKKLRPP